MSLSRSRGYPGTGFSATSCQPSNAGGFRRLAFNTVERYLGFIEFKYPDIKTKLIQIGDDSDEPASIYRLNYLH